MNTEQKINAVKKLISENRSFSFILKTPKYKELYDSIMSYTKQLDIKFKERIYWYINQLSEYPECALPGCNNKSTKFLKIESGYKKYCSASCAAKSDQCKKKHIDTCQQKYGVDNVAQCKNIQKKMQSTLLEKYGVANIGAYAPNREKVKTTNLKKYGTANGHKKDDNSKIGINISTARCTNFYNNVIKADTEVQPLFSIEEYINSSKYSEYRWHCNKCGQDFNGKLKNGKHIARCLNCYPYSESRPEQEVLEVLKESLLNLQIRQHDRSLLKPLEVDIYIPSLKLAIEFDGLYWHCDDVLLDKNYHLNKTQCCEKQGVQLIHVFENEWLFKQNIVKSKLKNLLGVYDKIVYARKCEVREVDSKASRAFQEENHLQGAVNAKVNLGLFYEDELVSLMTFGKCRFDKKHEWEMLRFCNKLGYHVVGGAGKLLKYFERTYQPKSLVSYADRRWSIGKLYNALGFKFTHASRPDYWYFNNKDFELKNRLKFQKHKLKDILEVFDDNKSEVQNMRDNGYHRIFDCGNLVFEKTYSSPQLLKQ